MENRNSINIIAAVTSNGAIGRNGGLACCISDDLKYFRRMTEGHVVIMGRGTFESMGRHPLKNRVNYVVSSQGGEGTEGVKYVPSVEKALELAARHHPHKKVWFIGGGQIYKYCLDRGLVDNMYLTMIDKVVEDASAWFPTYRKEDWEFIEGMRHFAEKEGVWVDFQLWGKKT